MEFTFESIIETQFTRAESDGMQRNAVDAYVRDAATVEGFRERDQWLAITARQRALELFGKTA